MKNFHRNVDIMVLGILGLLFTFWAVVITAFGVGVYYLIKFLMTLT